MIFQLGEQTRDVSCGDMVTTCEFIGYIPVDRYTPHKLLFYDLVFKCFRLCEWKKSLAGKTYLDGWNCANSISELLKK